MSDVLYRDDTVTVDGDGIVLRRYYFPTGTAKRVPFERIRGVELRPIGWTTGRGRLWGTGDPRYWMPLDLRRTGKRQLVVLDVGGRIRPAFTPDDPERVVALLRRRTGRA